MIDALYNGISGLSEFQTALNTETNNISNVNTVGYKSDKISFADQMYQSAIGKGVSMETIDKDFTQGNLKITNNAYDMAVKGKGFFIVKGDTQELFYTRSGNFRMSEDGSLRLPNEYQVQGLSANSTALLSTNGDKIFTPSYNKFIASQTIKDPTGDIVESINSKSTDYTNSAADDLENLKGNGYKTKEAKIADISALASEYRNELTLYSSSPSIGTAATKQISDITFDTTKLNNSIDSVELTIGSTTFRQAFEKDALTTLQLFADKISSKELLSASVDNAGKLKVTSMLPGKSTNIFDAKILNGASVTSPIPTIDTTQAIVGSGKAKLESIETELKLAIERADAKYLKISSIIDSTDIQNKSVGELQLKLNTLNISESPFGTTEIEDGIIYVKQDNNRFIVGKVVTAVFTNELGLDPKGGNLYAATTQSGGLRFGTTENEILSQTLELSNSELSESLVNLMVYQRAFEASSKSVTTSDEFLKTAIALKK